MRFFTMGGKPRTIFLNRKYSSRKRTIVFTEFGPLAIPAFLYKRCFAWSTRSRASSAVAPVADKWPIFRPARGVCFSYKCSRTPGTARAAAKSGSPFKPKIA